MTVTLPGHVSWSQLSTWMKCGRQYKLERLDKVEQVPGVWLVGGSAVHEWTELYDLGDDRCRTDPKGVWLEVFEKHFEETKAENEADHLLWRVAGKVTKEKPAGEDLSWWLNAGLNMCMDYTIWRTGYAADWELFEPGVEVDVSARFGQDFLKDDGTVLVKAHLDRLFVMPTGELIVVDIKTGTRVPDFQQVGLYATCVERTLGIRPSYGSYYMTRKGRVEAPVNLDWLNGEYWDEIFDQFRSALENQVFIPNPSGLCRTCSVNAHCSYYTPESRKVTSK